MFYFFIIAREEKREKKNAEWDPGCKKHIVSKESGEKKNIFSNKWKIMNKISYVQSQTTKVTSV